MAIEENIPRLILSQFRWLDHIVDSEGLAKKLVETLSVCTPRLKKEIVSFIPEIVDDYGHQVRSSSYSICSDIVSVDYRRIA
jgi:Fanconi anemia group D2 protein